MLRLRSLRCDNTRKWRTTDIYILRFFLYGRWSLSLKPRLVYQTQTERRVEFKWHLSREDRKIFVPLVSVREIVERSYYSRYKKKFPWYMFRTSLYRSNNRNHKIDFEKKTGRKSFQQIVLIKKSSSLLYKHYFMKLFIF